MTMLWLTSLKFGSRRPSQRWRERELVGVLPDGPEPAHDKFFDGEMGWCVTPDNEFVVQCRIHYYRGDPGIYVLQYDDPHSSGEIFDGWAYKTEAKARLARQWAQLRRHKFVMESLREDDARHLQVQA